MIRQVMGKMESERKKEKTKAYPTFSSDLRIGLPTMEGKMVSGKLVPANPAFTKPVPLSHTTTRDIV